jgi:hypothetical protein
VPFKSWECITLQLEDREVDLVIKNEEEMIKLITLIVFHLKTVDNNKDSAVRDLSNATYW